MLRTAARRTVAGAVLSLALGLAGPLSSVPATAVTAPGTSVTAAAPEDESPVNTVVRGWVRSGDHTPIADHAVFMRTDERGSLWRRVATSSADEAWQIDGLAEGIYHFYAAAPGDPDPTDADSIVDLEGSAPSQVNVIAGDRPTWVELSLHPWTHLVGRVEVPAEYRATTSIKAFLSSGGTSVRRDAAADGTWAFRRMYPGQRRLTVQATFTHAGHTTTFAVPTGQRYLDQGTTDLGTIALSVFEYDLPTYDFDPTSGRVRVDRWDDSTRSWVFADLLMGEDEGTRRLWVTATPGRHRFTLISHHLLDGDRALLPSQPVEVSVAAGKRAVVPNLALGSASGTITLPAKAAKEGRPTNLRLFRFSPGTKQWDDFAAGVAVDARGGFDLGRTPAGRYRLVADVPAMLRHEFTVAPGKATRVAWNEQLRPIGWTGKKLRVKTRKRPRTGDQLQARSGWPSDAGVLGVGVRYEWWSTSKVTKGKKKGRWRKAKRIRRATDATFVPGGKYRGHKIKVRMVADSPMHTRRVFSSAWTKPLR